MQWQNFAPYAQREFFTAPSFLGISTKKNLQPLHRFVKITKRTKTVLFVTFVNFNSFQNLAANHLYSR